LQMKARRKELMDKANRIKSLENSPVNERQLSVLRMIYDEITMYPCESWMC
jgi:IS4 transposase